MKGHFQVEWHAAQSVQEVLQRDGVQFPSFIRQMSRVGRDGGEEQNNTGSRWVKEAWEIKNKVGGGSFDKRNTAKMVQMPGKDPNEWWGNLRNLAPSAECRQGLLVLPLASSRCG